MAYINSKSQWSYSLHVEYSKIGLIYVDSIGIVPRIACSNTIHLKCFIFLCRYVDI